MGFNSGFKGLMAVHHERCSLVLLTLHNFK